MSNNLEFWGKKLEENEQNILVENYRLLRRHIRRLEAGNVKERTIVNHIQVLLPFAKWCKTDFKLLCDDDIFDYSEYLGRKTYTREGKARKYTQATLYAHKACIKTFLNPINSVAASAILLKKNRQELPEILTEDDIGNMIKAALNARDRALISCLYESGARKGELLSVRLKHLTFDDNGVVMVLPQGKTGPRRIRLVFSSSYLREWVGVHPTGDDRESIVFCALRSPFPAISDTGLHYQLRKLAKRAGVKKRVNAHSFRHASVTRMAKHLSEQELKVYYGWTRGSDMTATYVHLAGEDIDDSILKMHGIKTASVEDSLRVSRCPRCKELLPESSAYCNKCGLPLQDAVKTKIETDAADLDMGIIRAALLNPEILNEIAKRVNKKD